MKQHYRQSSKPPPPHGCAPPPWAHKHHERWRLRRYLGKRMHRQLLVWFGLAIVAAIGAAGLALRVTGEGSQWTERRDRVLSLVLDEFAQRWEQPAARAAFAENISQRLEAGVELRDVHNNLLLRYGMREHCRWREQGIVYDRFGARLGSARFCLDPWTAGNGRRTALSLGAAMLVLWLLAGSVASRLTRPLRELTYVAQELGQGRLDRRARLRHGQPGEVGELTLAINEMAERIERQLRDQKELLAAVSHEMRSPLTRIRLLTELAREGDPSAHLDGIEAEVLEMDRLVGDLLARARLDFSVLQPQKLDLREVLRSAVERASLPSEALEAPEGPVWIQGDATLLGRAFGALLDNARKYGAAPFHVSLERNTAGRLRVTIRDGGDGFPEGASEQWFEPFRRGHRDGGGLGLGLALVRRIAEAHGGTAGVGPGPGGHVWIELRAEGPVTPPPSQPPSP